MPSNQSYQGSCFCGEVTFTVTGEAVGMGYCHCSSCRSWAAAPINRFTLWHPEAIKITKGADKIGVFNKTPRSSRKWCKTCGGHLMTEHPHWKLTDVYHAVIPDFPFKAGLHANYAERVLSIKDGLPKLADFPTELGGTGKTVEE